MSTTFAHCVYDDELNLERRLLCGKGGFPLMQRGASFCFVSAVCVPFPVREHSICVPLEVKAFRIWR